MKQEGDGIVRRGRARTARGTEECGRGGEQGQLGRFPAALPPL